MTAPVGNVRPLTAAILCNTNIAALIRRFVANHRGDSSNTL
jgi:hypothetical protein